MSREGLAELRAYVHETPEAAARLAAASGEAFVESLLALADGLRLDVTAGDIEDAIASGRRAWTIRWLR